MRPLSENDMTDLETAIAGRRLAEDPGPEAEALIVDALQRRGLLRPSASRHRRGTGLALAAAVLILAAGFAAGEYDGTRRHSWPQTSQASPALAVQRTGSDYVAAVATLARLPAASDTAAQRSLGKEVAVSTLKAAALEIERIAPGEALVSEPPLALAHESRRSELPATSDSLIWY